MAETVFSQVSGQGGEISPLGQRYEEVTMKRKVSVLVLIVVTLLLVFVGIDGLALVSADGTPATVPFKATYTTFPEPVDGGADYFILDIPADGKGTHLGKSNWYAVSTVSTATFPWEQWAEEMFFTAANGDQLIGHFAGEAVPNDSGGANFNGDYWITEGTGRFTGTTGSGTYDGEADEGIGILIFEGTLTNP